MLRHKTNASARGHHTSAQPYNHAEGTAAISGAVRCAEFCFRPSQERASEFLLLQWLCDLELAESIWRKVHGASRPFRVISEPALAYDVQVRLPDTAKARMVLGFEARTSLSAMLDEVIPWIKDEIRTGRI